MLIKPIQHLWGSFKKKTVNITFMEAEFSYVFETNKLDNWMYVLQQLQWMS